MTVEENKALVQRYVEEIWNKGNIAKEGEFVARDIVVHDPLIQKVTMFRTALPDLHLTNNFVFGEGDKVVQSWTIHGTHTGGELLGIPATDKQFTITGMNEYRVAGDKIVERWGELDRLGMLQQLGVVPEPGRASG